MNRDEILVRYESSHSFQSQSLISKNTKMNRKQIVLRDKKHFHYLPIGTKSMKNDSNSTSPIKNRNEAKIFEKQVL